MAADEPEEQTFADVLNGRTAAPVGEKDRTADAAGDERRQQPSGAVAPAHPCAAPARPLAVQVEVSTSADARVRCTGPRARGSARPVKVKRQSVKQIERGRDFPDRRCVVHRLTGMRIVPGIHDEYTREMYDKFGYLACWLPSIGLALGDVGTIEGRRFGKLTTLDELGVSFSVDAPSVVGDLEYATAGAVTVAVSGEAGPFAAVSITFTSRGATYFQAGDCVATTVTSLPTLEKQFAAAVRAGAGPGRQLRGCGLPQVTSAVVPPTDLPLEGVEAMPVRQNQCGNDQLREDLGSLVWAIRSMTFTPGTCRAVPLCQRIQTAVAPAA